MRYEDEFEEFEELISGCDGTISDCLQYDYDY